MAGPLTAGYRLKKFIRRHKALVGGVAAVLAVSVIGTIVSVTFALGQARALAKAELIADYLEKDVLDVIAKERGRELTAHHILEVISENLEVRFKDYPLVEASIRSNLGYIYNWGLNDYKVAVMHMERAARINQEHLGEEYEFSNTLGSIYNRLGRYKEAESEFDSLLEIRRRKGGDELYLTFQKCNLACVYFNQGRYEEAEVLFLDTWEIALRGNREDWVRNYECSLADVYRAQGKDGEAERLYKAGISRSKPEDGWFALNYMCGLAHLRMAQGHYDDANDLLVKACEIGREELGEEHPHTLRSINSLAVLRREQEQYDEAEALFLEALDGRRSKLDEDHPATLETKNDLAVLYRMQARFEEAESLLLEAVKGRRLKLGDEHPYTLVSWNNLIELYEVWNKPEKAELWRAKLPHNPNVTE